jgi:transcriptional regulator with XRE-family HTH domain
LRILKHICNIKFIIANLLILNYLKINKLSSTLQERLKTVFLEYRLTQKSFSDKTGIATSALSGIMGKRQSNPSFEAIQKITIAFPEINMNWLISEQGQMLEKQPETDIILQEKYISAMERLAKAQEDNLDLIHQIHQLKTDLADCKNQKVTDTKS